MKHASRRLQAGARFDPPMLWLRAAALGLLLLSHPPGAPATPLPRHVILAASPTDAPGKSCARKWEAYRRSAMCYASFRSHDVLEPGARQRCGPPLKEPGHCPRPRRSPGGAR